MAYTQENYSTRELVAKNILHLISVSELSRKDFAAKIDVPYTTLCNWIMAKSYPRIEALEKMADCFGIQVGDFFIDIEHAPSVEKRLLEYARRIAMTKDYSYTYPGGFFDLFGAISDESFVIPEDLPAEEESV